MNKLLKALMLALCAVAPLHTYANEDQEQVIAQNYSFAPTTHLGANHTYMGVSFFGDEMELEDGSEWTMRSDQRWIALDWIPGDAILITQSSWWSQAQYGFYYSAYNLRTAQSIDVAASTGPAFGSYYKRSIVSINSYYGEGSLMLDDGSLWVLNESTRYVWERWYVGDSILIGSNSDTFGSWSFPNLLINFTCSQTSIKTKCYNVY